MMVRAGESLLEEVRPLRGRVVDQNLFLFLLDLEVKRSRRYQNFLCLILIHIKLLSTENSGDGEKERSFYRIVTDLIKEETRDCDIIGCLGTSRLAVLLPYADLKAGDHMKSRIEGIMKYDYDAEKRGFEVNFDQVCFPIHGADTMDFIQKALRIETPHEPDETMEGRSQ